MFSSDKEIPNADWHVNNKVAVCTHVSSGMSMAFPPKGSFGKMVLWTENKWVGSVAFPTHCYSQFLVLAENGLIGIEDELHWLIRHFGQSDCLARRVDIETYRRVIVTLHQDGKRHKHAE
jgi:hypothetical protein